MSIDFRFTFDYTTSIDDFKNVVNTLILKIKCVG
jgi:hypothetical protein